MAPRKSTLAWAVTGTLGVALATGGTVAAFSESAPPAVSRPAITVPATAGDDPTTAVGPAEDRTSSAGGGTSVQQVSPPSPVTAPTADSAD